MIDFETMQSGLLYDANYDPELVAFRNQCKELCYDYNALRPSRTAERAELLRRILGHTGKDPCIVSPFWCDLGRNLSVGDFFYANHNCVILDEAAVTFGDCVFIGPNCCFSTASHPLDAERRSAGYEFALPITVGSNVWFGANVSVLPGVTIGDGAVIGAGSVVNRDIPAGVIAVGSPCRVLRPITDADKDTYQLAP